MEWKSGVSSKYYIYRLDSLDQWSYVGGVPQPSYYVHDAFCAPRMSLRDGHGSVRALTDSTGTVTDT